MHAHIHTQIHKTKRDWQQVKKHPRNDAKLQIYKAIMPPVPPPTFPSTLSL